jgi:hypothetical protein
MIKSSPLAEATFLLDSIIDDSLDCQEQILRRDLSHLPDFANWLEKIISVKNKVSAQFYNQLESLITSLRPPKPMPVQSFSSN